MNEPTYTPLTTGTLESLERAFDHLMIASCELEQIEYKLLEEAIGPDYEQDNPPPLEGEILEAATKDVDRASSALYRILKAHGRITEPEKREDEPIQEMDIPF